MEGSNEGPDDGVVAGDPSTIRRAAGILVAKGNKGAASTTGGVERANRDKEAATDRFCRFGVCNGIVVLGWQDSEPLATKVASVFDSSVGFDGGEVVVEELDSFSRRQLDSLLGR